MMKELYRMHLSAGTDSIYVRCEVWCCIHETECFWFCVNSAEIGIFSILNKGEDLTLQRAKKSKILVKRIHKSRSRFAFESKDKALDNLMFRKRKQNEHLSRQLKENNLFIENCKSIKDLIESFGLLKVPNTKEYCRETYREY